jgi:DNA-binding NarL/FixJ family response regulator
MKVIKILLVEDHTIVREGLRMMLEAAGGFEVVGEAATGRDAVRLTKKLHPDVVVMDVALPRLNGIEAARQILLAVPATKVLILSAHSDDEYITRVLEIGAAGFLVKQNSVTALTRAIRQIAKGERFFDASISKRFQKSKVPLPGRTEPPAMRRNRLTSREQEVLQLVAEGAANKQVAAELGISIKTVEKHRQQLMDKLGIHDTAGLTRYAISAGIIENSVQITIL